MTRAEMQEEGNNVKDYYLLQEAEEITFEMIKYYSFCISDCTTRVGVLTDDYQELRKQFRKYAKDKMILDEWKLPKELELTEENLETLDDELRAIGDSYLEKKFKLLISRY